MNPVYRTVLLTIAAWIIAIGTFFAIVKGVPWVCEQYQEWEDARYYEMQ